MIAAISSNVGEHPAHFRVLVVDRGKFSMRLEEWAYLDALHYGEDTSYLVVKAGRHSLQAGASIQAPTAQVDHQWRDVFSVFGQRPVVLSQCMSAASPGPVVTRQSQLRTGEGLQVRIRLQEERGRAQTHVAETVGCVALLRS